MDIDSLQKLNTYKVFRQPRYADRGGRGEEKDMVAVSALRRRRLSQGLTMQQVADGAGMSLLTYAKKERGLRRVSAPETKRLARVLGCSVSDISEGEQS